MAGSVMTLVVLGRTFHSLTPAPVDRTPKHEPPAVTTNPAATLTELRAVRRRVPFRLQLPSVLEKTSEVAGPPRVYRISGRNKAVRLTFRRPAGCASAGIACEYWGVEQTAWKDAPVLAERSFDHVLKGRRYSFYWTGSHLHMIVLRDGGATYWVVNTLLDSLSNETMIAIAKGLRPLRR
jgi:hypothetical protein